MKTAKEIIIPCIALCVICTVIVTALVGTNHLTSDKIKEINSENESKAMNRIISAESYEKAVITSDGTEYSYYKASDESGIIGYIFTVSEKGYGGDVSVMTGVNIDGTIAGIEVLDASNETPGLGQNSKKSDFANQFTGKSGTIGISKSASNGNEITALTGATITTKAVTASVNKALSLYENIEKAGD